MADRRWVTGRLGELGFVVRTDELKPGLHTAALMQIYNAHLYARQQWFLSDYSLGGELRAQPARRRGSSKARSTPLKTRSFTPRSCRGGERARRCGHLARHAPARAAAAPRSRGGVGGGGRDRPCALCRAAADRDRRGPGTPRSAGRWCAGRSTAWLDSQAESLPRSGA